MPRKILATADLHLGRKSTQVSIDSDENATKYTWQRLIRWAFKNQVDAVVLAGDIIDRDNRYFEAIGPIHEGFEKLGAAGIPVIMTAGNHDFDVLRDIMQSNDYAHVHLLGENGQWEARTIETKSGPIQFLGWSFPQQYIHEDPLLKLASFEIPLNDDPTIGILHGALNAPESKYAPIEMNRLMGKNVNAWVLGHIHKPVIHHENSPLIFYSGSPHALSPKETGRHGPHLLTIESREKATHKQVLLSPVRYEKLNVDITKVADQSEFRNLIVNTVAEDFEQKKDELQHVSRVIYDIILTGKHALKAEFSAWHQNVDDFERTFGNGTTVSIRKISNKIEPEVQNLEELAHQPDPAGILAQAILDIQAGKSSKFLENLSAKFRRQLSKMNTAKTYQPLHKDGRQYDNAPEHSEIFLLQECEQLLANLLAQKDKS